MSSCKNEYSKHTALGNTLRLGGNKNVTPLRQTLALMSPTAPMFVERCKPSGVLRCPADSSCCRNDGILIPKLSSTHFGEAAAPQACVPDNAVPVSQGGFNVFHMYLVHIEITLIRCSKKISDKPNLFHKVKHRLPRAKVRSGRISLSTRMFYFSK